MSLAGTGPAVAGPMDGQRQLERATRLLDSCLGLPQGRRTPVRKALEQLFGEARSCGPAGLGLVGASYPTGAGASRLLQSHQAYMLDRDVADFALGTHAAPSVFSATGGATASTITAAESPGLKDFFGLHHERVVLCAVEEAQRGCLHDAERHAFNRIQVDWEERKAQILSAMSPNRLGAASVGAALRRAPGRAAGNAAMIGGEGAAVAPPQDAAIVDALLREPVGLDLVRRVARLSCESCPPYHAELDECWGIVANQLAPSKAGAVRGALTYLQQRFAVETRAVLYRSANARLGGIQDAWSLVCALGRKQFDLPLGAAFPSDPAHVWYAAFVAARAGLLELLSELPERAAACAERCPELRTVCTLLARRLEAAASPDGTAAADTAADAADLLRADLAEDGNGFQNIIIALLLGRSFAFGRLPGSTVEDWLWFRLHALSHSAGANDQNPEFLQQLKELREYALAIPMAHYEPGAAAGGGSGVQTLNFVKILLLTAQFGRAVQQLRSQDTCLRGPALHIALVLHRAGTLEAVEEPPPCLAGLICDYAADFGCSDQLQYFRILSLPDRVAALQRLLLSGGVGTNDDLLGYIDGNGRHRAGLLERTLHEEESAADGGEFVALCAQAGRAACERGQYREAIRLLHLGRSHGEVLAVLNRCLRMPVWREPDAATSNEASLLAQEVQRFVSIYERNLDRYALSSQIWAVTRRLHATRSFHILCDRGQPEAALDLFDREQLLPLGVEQEVIGQLGADASAEVQAEQPHVVRDYVRILRHAASQGADIGVALRLRVRQLQAFLATRSHVLVLDADTIAALAGLSLC